jgi:LysR family transcriptional activator of nhaA
MAARYRHNFPQSLNGAPMFLPTDNTALRRNLNFWFESKGIRPIVLGEFEDYALLRAFGETGQGVFPLPAVVETQVRKQKALNTIGATDEVQTQFYAISSERKLQHPAVVAIRNAARHQLFK